MVTPWLADSGQLSANIKYPVIAATHRWHERPAWAAQAKACGYQPFLALGGSWN
jgi:hypothetical protein